ncbi:MAG: hypothetical protein AB2L20_30135 [Mangrovibacterium sp.]
MNILNLFRSEPADFKLLLSSANGAYDLYCDNVGRYFIADHRIEPVYMTRNKDKAFSRFIALIKGQIN